MTKSATGVLTFAFVAAAPLVFAQPPKPAAEKPAATKPAAAEKGAAGEKAAAAPAMVPTPSPELDTLYKALEGSWKCETVMAAGSAGPGSPEMNVKSTVKISKAKDLSGFWYRGEYEIKKSKTAPGFKGTFMLGYDDKSKTAIDLSYDNMGSASLATSTNATPDSVTFMGESYMMGMKVKTRETMTKKGPKEVEHKFEADMGKGFQVLGTDDCKK